MLSSVAVKYSERLLEAAVCLTHPPVTEDIQILFTDKMSSNRGTCMLKGDLGLFRSFEKQINVSSLLSLSLSHPLEQNIYDRLRVSENLLLRRNFGRRERRRGDIEKCDNVSCYGAIASVLSKFLPLTYYLGKDREYSTYFLLTLALDGSG